MNQTQNEINAAARLEKELQDAGFVVSIEATQDDTPVRGNASVSGDDAQDRETENHILERVQITEWAWAVVKVQVIEPHTCAMGDAYMGQCSYDDEADFRKNGEYEDLLREAAEACRQELERMVKVAPEKLGKLALKLETGNNDEETVLKLIKKHDDGRGAPWEVLCDHGNQHGITDDDVDTLINKLLADGKIFEPVLGRLKIASL